MTTIKRLRREKNITTAELARLLGYKSASAITMIENGDRGIPSDRLLALAEILGCAVDELLREPEEEKPASQGGEITKNGRNKNQ